MPNFKPKSIEYAWVSLLSDNPWGFIQSNTDKSLFFFYFDLNTLTATNQTNNIYGSPSISFGAQDNFSIGQMV